MGTHLITGASGQDGVLLSRRLVADGETVVASSLGVAHEFTSTPTLRRVSLDVTDGIAFRSALREHKPDVVHNLAGQSSVAESWADPTTSERVNHQAVVQMLEILQDESPSTRFIHASSSEIFGRAPGAVAHEETPHAPQSPYADAKAKAHDAVRLARDAGLRATNVVLFGHTSPLQPPRFVLPSICNQAVDVRLGRSTSIRVQNPDTRRDWGSAEDHVRAFSLAATGPPNDYVVATGVLTALSRVAAWALAAVDRPDAPVDRTSEARPQDHDGVRGDYTRASRDLGWKPSTSLQEEITAMIEHRYRRR